MKIILFFILYQYINKFGLNFRIFLAAQNKLTKEIDILDCIINTPFQQSNQEYTVYSSKILQMTGNVSINNSQYNNVNTVVNDFIKKKVLEIISLSYYEITQDQFGNYAIQHIIE